MRRWNALLALIVGLSFAASGCSKEKKKDDDDSEEKSEKSSKKKKKASVDDEEEDEGKSKKKKKAASDDEEEDDGKSKKKKAAAADDDSSGDDKIGIKACDDYIDKMNKCFKAIKNMPEESLATMKKGMADSRKAWAAAAKNTAAKKGLEDGCKQALTSSKTAYKTLCKGVFDDE